MLLYDHSDVMTFIGVSLSLISMLFGDRRKLFLKKNSTETLCWFQCPWSVVNPNLLCILLLDVVFQLLCRLSLLTVFS